MKTTDTLKIYLQPNLFLNIVLFKETAEFANLCLNKQAPYTVNISINIKFQCISRHLKPSSSTQKYKTGNIIYTLILFPWIFWSIFEPQESHNALKQSLHWNVIFLNSIFVYLKMQGKYKQIKWQPKLKFRAHLLTTLLFIQYSKTA